MMELLEDVFIRCEQCGRIIGIHKEDFDFESYVYDHGENGMGEEIEYRHDGFIECDGCGNEISFRISGYEYPVGAFNYEDSEITGGSFGKEPHMGVIYSRDDFDPNDAYPEYSRVEQLIMEIAQDRDLIYNISPREFEEIFQQSITKLPFNSNSYNRSASGLA